MPFLVIEGIDGSGKSTVARALQERMEAAGWSVLVLREPGSTPLGERVRSILLDPDVGDLGPWTEVNLFTACRAELVPRVIRPALDAGRLVILDRYFYSTVCYQGFACDLDVDVVWRQNVQAVGGLEPGRVLFLDLPVDEAIARREGEGDRMEQKGDAFLERVRAGYRELARRDPERWITIDASAEPEDVARRAGDAIGAWLGEAP